MNKKQVPYCKHDFDKKTMVKKSYYCNSCDSKDNCEIENFEHMTEGAIAFKQGKPISSNIYTGFVGGFNAAHYWDFGYKFAARVKEYFEEVI